MFEWPKESLLDSAADEPVGLFDLTVGLWMSYGGIAYIDSQVSQKPWNSLEVKFVPLFV